MPGACPSPDHNPVPVKEWRDQGWTFQCANMVLHKADLSMVAAVQAGVQISGIQTHPQQLLPCREAQHHSVSLFSAWLHLLTAEMSSLSTVGHCWEEERKNLAVLRLWQGIVQAQACRGKRSPHPTEGRTVLVMAQLPTQSKNRHKFAKPASLAASLTKTSKHNVSIM